MHQVVSRISSINSIIKINPWSRFLSNHFELPDFHKMPIFFSNWMLLREIILPLHQQGMYHNAPAISRVLPLTAHPTHPTAPSNRNPTWNTSLRASASATLVVPKRIPRLNCQCPLWKRRNVRPKPPIFWGFQQLVFGGVHGFRKGRWCSSSFQRAFGAPDEGFQSSYAQTINEPVATATTITIVIIEFCRDLETQRCIIIAQVHPRMLPAHGCCTGAHLLGLGALWLDLLWLRHSQARRGHVGLGAFVASPTNTSTTCTSSEDPRQFFCTY